MTTFKSLRRWLMVVAFGLGLPSAAAAAPALSRSPSSSCPSGWICGSANSADPPALSSAPISEPPTTSAKVSGSGFGVTEAVDLFFDTADLVLTVSDATGAFSATLRVPGSAQPGTHWITGIGRTSGLAAQKSFLVRTNWSQFRNGVRHKGLNPFENVLSPGNVAALNEAWTGLTGSLIQSSPAAANGVLYVGSEDHKL